MASASKCSAYTQSGVFPEFLFKIFLSISNRFKRSCFTWSQRSTMSITVLIFERTRLVQVAELIGSKGEGEVDKQEGVREEYSCTLIYYMASQNGSCIVLYYIPTLVQ